MDARLRAEILAEVRKAMIGDPIPETGQCSVTITRIA